MRIDFPWPDKGLSPNARLHTMQVARLKADARAKAAWWALSKLGRAGNLWGEAPHLSITFLPPDNRRRDLDNMLASCKACLDGLSDALGVDDSKWTLSLARGPKVKGGLVSITISAAQAATQIEHRGQIE